jgi:hypothetical protein
MVANSFIALRAPLDALTDRSGYCPMTDFATGARPSAHRTEY